MPLPACMSIVDFCSGRTDRRTNERRYLNRGGRAAMRFNRSIHRRHSSLQCRSNPTHTVQDIPPTWYPRQHPGIRRNYLDLESLGY